MTKLCLTMVALVVIMAQCCDSNHQRHRNHQLRGHPKHPKFKRLGEHEAPHQRRGEQETPHQRWGEKKTPHQTRLGQIMEQLQRTNELLMQELQEPTQVR